MSTIRVLRIKRSDSDHPIMVEPTDSISEEILSFVESAEPGEVVKFEIADMDEDDLGGLDESSGW